MAKFKTPIEAAQIVFGLLSSLTIKRHLMVRKTKDTSTEYIVVNALPINAGVMQKCYVNVNFHVKDLADGTPNTARLNAVSTMILDILEEVDGDGYLIDFESAETFQEPALGEHFANLRYSVKVINQ